MSKPLYMGMRLHQGISFSRAVSHIDRAEAVFWPGCALMSLDPAILVKTYSVLKRAEPELGVSTCCCSQPSQYLFPNRYPERREYLLKTLSSSGVRRIYAACPNCVIQLRALNTAEVTPIWQVLSKHITPEDISRSEYPCTMHDPCPMRSDAAQMAAVRALCAMSGAEVCEPSRTMKTTSCCGNFHMMHITDPARSALMLERRLGDLPKDRAVVSCCEGCLGAFRRGGLDTVHVLELLFGRSGKRGWGNRIAYSLHFSRKNRS